MRDLIDREAALNCFHSWVDKYGDVYTPDEMPEYQAIEALPSAQPEDIQKIQDLEQAQFDKIRELAYQDGKADAMRWIPCSERLPEEAGWYIASGVRDVGNRWYSTLHGWEETTFRVVAWMPFPEPYKGDDK